MTLTGQTKRKKSKKEKEKGRSKHKSENNSRMDIENISKDGSEDMDIEEMDDNKKTQAVNTQVELKIAQWNARSLCSLEKIAFIEALKADIMTIQEIWKRTQEVEGLSGTIISMSTRESGQNGGGTATLNYMAKHPDILTNFTINKDSKATKIRLRQGFFCWIINFYNHNGKISKVQKLFGKIRQKIPHNEWKFICIIGDFNIKASEMNEDFKIVKSMAKQMGLATISPNEPTHQKGHTLDYLIHGSLFAIKEHKPIHTNLSDHCALVWELSLKPATKTKVLTIVDKEEAEANTSRIISSNKVQNAQDFLRETKELRQREGIPMKTIKYTKRRDEALLDKLLALDNSSEINNIVDEHWKTIWQETEAERFSVESKVAYARLKKILKYNLFEKRDSSIVSCVLNDEGDLIEDSEKVAKELMKTIQEIQVDEKWGWIEKKKFPKLPRINEHEMKQILDLISNGKAVAYDGVTDALFRKPRDPISKAKKKCLPHCLYELAKTKLRNIWRVELDQFLEEDDTWAARLVPLNKVAPRIPNRLQFRPIMVQSPLVKLLEARFLPKLQRYLEERLGASQTGFVPHMGTQVNIQRALERITKRTKANRCVYGLFIDFSNAYNSIPHSLLFQKLRTKQILDDDEICFLEQLYARYTIRIGSETVKVNRGVAQGSLISPALFNIFIEDLAEELELKASIAKEDLLMYADDILTLCTSNHQLETAVAVIEDWSKRNGMVLNKSKSGIVIFADRRAKKIPKMRLTSKNELKKPGDIRKWESTQDQIKGIPICSEYKYLGTILNPKLSCDPQKRHIRKKAAFMYTKLYPYLTQASADGRRDMFMTMIAPLFTAAMMILEYEPSKTHRTGLIRLYRMLFKQFMGLSQRTNTELVDEMLAKDLADAARQECQVAKEKWESRREREQINMITRYNKHEKKMKGVPKEWIDLVNYQTKICPICGKRDKIMSPWHLKYYHGYEVKKVNTIWRKEICPLSTSIKRLMKLRTKIKNETGNLEKSLHCKIHEVRKKIYERINSHLDRYEALLKREKMCLE